jgi:N-acetyltransferase
LNLQPQHLQNEWIQLVPLQVTDFEALYAVAADPLLWEQHPNKLRYKQEVFQNYFDGAILSKGAFLILEAKSKEVIGSSRFYDYNEKDSSLLIGYTFIGRNFWGKESNQALKKCMLDYAFQHVNSVYFHIGACNIRSQKAIEKLGAIKVDEQNVSYHGEENTLNYIYKITKY